MVSALVAVEFVARAYALSRLASEGRERGVAATAEGCFVTPLGIVFRGVDLSGQAVRGHVASLRVEWIPGRQIVIRDGEVSLTRPAERGAPAGGARGGLGEFRVSGERIALQFTQGSRSGRCDGTAFRMAHGEVEWSCGAGSARVGAMRFVAHDVTGSWRGGRLTVGAGRAAVTPDEPPFERSERAMVGDTLADPRVGLALLKAARERAIKGLQVLADAGRVRVGDALIAGRSLGPIEFEWGSAEGPEPVSTATRFHFRGPVVDLRLNGFQLARVLAEHPAWCASAEARLTGSVRFNAEDEVLSGEFNVSGLCAEHSRLADGPLRLPPVSVEFRVAPNAGEAWRIFAAVARGEAKLIADLVIAPRAGRRPLQLEIHVPEVRCQVAFDALPVGSWSRLAGTELTGTVALDAQLSVESGEKMDPKLDYTVSDRCRFVRVPRDLSRDAYRKPFQYRVYGPDGEESVRTAGPGAPGWTPHSRLGTFLPLAVVAMEDATFFKHRGFHHPSLKSALAANLRAGAFVRGGSTVTMQLAKNLFLTRRKTLLRKLEEVLLADYLEQAFSKEELLELYLNVIEFGPNVYGVWDAARYYFGTVPSELSLGEALFLISVLPSPVKHAAMRANGTVPEGWVRYLRRAAENLRRVGSLEPEDVEEAFREPIGFVGHRKPPSTESTEEPPFP